MLEDTSHIPLFLNNNGQAQWVTFAPLCLATLIQSGKTWPDPAYSHLCHHLAAWCWGTSPGYAAFAAWETPDRRKTSCWSTWQWHSLPAPCSWAGSLLASQPLSTSLLSIAGCSQHWLLHFTDCPQLWDGDSHQKTFIYCRHVLKYFLVREWRKPCVWPPPQYPYLNTLIFHENELKIEWTLSTTQGLPPKVER